MADGIKFLGDNNQSSLKRIGNICFLSLCLDTTKLTNGNAFINIPNGFRIRADNIQLSFIASSYDGISYVIWINPNGNVNFAGEIDFPRKNYVTISCSYVCQD